MVRKGPYGHYVQLGEGAEGEKPKRQSIPKGIEPNDVTIEQARKLLINVIVIREYDWRNSSGGKLLADRALSRLLKDDWPRTIDALEKEFQRKKQRELARAIKRARFLGLLPYVIR